MIRRATMQDLGALIAMGADMHAESTFAPMRYDPRHLGEFLVNLIASPNGAVFLAVADDAPVGLILCTCNASFFGPDRTACELAFYVRPEHRGSQTAMQLLRAYVEWAKQQGAVRINAGNSAGMLDEQYVRLLEHAGFTRAGSLMYTSM